MTSNRNIKRILIITGFLVINFLILYGISQIWVYLNTGANKDKIFHPDVKNESYYTPKVVWSSTENPGRPFTESAKQKLKKDYLDAWYVRNEAFRTNGIGAIPDFYTEKAKKNLLDFIHFNRTQGIILESTTLAHNLKVEFYSADGNLIVLTDEDVRSISRAFHDGKFMTETEEIADYRVTLLLEDGFWKIRHIEKTKSGTPSQINPLSNDILSQPLSGINYYPQFSPWDTFGESFSEEILNQDFKLIKDLNLNTIRIFIGYEDFGKVEVSEDKIAKLLKLLDTAKQNDLGVVITLFDFYGDYSVSDWSLTHRHALHIVNATKHHPALLSWDLKNEPDLDFKSRGKDMIVSWLMHTIQLIRREDPVHPITIGWSSPSSAQILEEQVDYVSYHYYEDIDLLAETHQNLQAKVNKPLVLQELGLSTNVGIWSPFGASEQGQMKYFKSFFEIQDHTPMNYFIWTLYDFPEVPAKIGSNRPWRKNKQSNFGLIEENGSRKKSYYVVRMKQ